VKKTILLPLASAVFVAALAFTDLASAQSTWTNTASGNWLTGANWSTGTAPDSSNAVAVFTNAITASWTNDTVTVGTISNLVTSGSVVVGNNGIATDVIELATTSGKPTIFVTNNGTIFMYANVTGTNGFSKTGGGTLAFRFNTDNMTYTGDVLLAGGTLSLEKDASLGNVSNNILVGANSTLLSAPGSGSGTVTLTNTRGIVVSNGVTLSVQNNNATTFTTINGNISGAGDLAFVGPSAGVSDLTSYKFTFGGTNTSTGQTTVQMGAKLTLGSTGVLSTNLSISGGSGTWAGVDLGGTTQNLTRFALASASTTARTIVLSNGTLNVTNAAGAFTFNGTNGTVLDMSGLTAFTFNGAIGNRNITIQPNIHTGAGFNTNYVYLATNGIGSNSLTANAILVGGANGGSAGNGNEARLLLGKINEIGATSFTIGGFNGSGVVAFGTGITDGSVKLTGSNGVARMGLLVVGETSSGTRRGFGTLDLGTANASISNAYVGVFGANSVANLTLTNQITMAGGTFDALNLYLGAVTNTTIVSSSITNISIFQQNGGTNTIGLLRMGDDKSTAASDTLAFQSSYNLVGANAVLKAQTIDAGTNAVFGANASRTLRMSNNATLQNASGVDLSVTGFNNTAAGRMNIALDGNGTVEADSGRSVTFGANTRLSGAGDLTKTGAGTLILSSGIAGANTGALNISNGVVQLNATGVAAAGTVTSVAVGSGATLLISQSEQVNNTAAVTLSGGTISRAGGVSETFGTLTLTGNSFLNFGGVSEAANLTFGTLNLGGYNVSVSGFALNNQLKYAAASEASGLSLLSSFSFDNSYTTSFSPGTSTFTITAIPEPSTYLAAAGLIGLMLWPARRRLLRDAKSILALRSGRRA
jgi:autotransporter-associated beta strand protein